MSNQLSSLTTAQLRNAAYFKEMIAALNRELESIFGASVPLPKGKMSAAGRARIAVAQRARWAMVKSAKPAIKAAAKTPAKKKGLGAAAKAKLSAMAKARWANVKRTGKKAL